MSKSTMKNLFFKSLRSKQIAITVVSLTLFVTVISLVLFEGTKKSITLDVNGEELNIKTHAHTVGELLSEQEIEVAEHDLVIPSVNTPIEDGLSIRWEQSQTSCNTSRSRKYKPFGRLNIRLEMYWQKQVLKLPNMML